MNAAARGRLACVRVHGRRRRRGRSPGHPGGARGRQGGGDDSAPGVDGAKGASE